MKKIFQKIKKVFFYNLALLYRPKREAYYQEISIPFVDDEKYLQILVDDWEKGIGWCKKSTEYWAIIKTVEITKSIITFNLGIIAFDAAAHLFFSNVQNFLVSSIALSAISIFILTWFLRTVTNMNINNIGDREIVLKKSLQKLFKEPQEAIDYYNTEINKCMDGLKNHEEVWKPLQDIGLYCFIGSVVSVAVGIVLLKI